MREVGRVEECGQAGMAGFLHWHYKCRSCGVLLRVTTDLPRAFVCSKCGSRYQFDIHGRVYVDSGKPSGSVAKYDPSLPAQARDKPRFLDRLVGAAADANEAAHGKRLRDGLASSGNHLKQLDEQVLNVAMSRFVEKCEQLDAQQINWSKDGRIKMGRALQEEAKKQYDFNQAESFALWLAGAWLESGSRNSDDAVFVRSALEHLRGTLFE